MFVGHPFTPILGNYVEMAFFAGKPLDKLIVIDYNNYIKNVPSLEEIEAFEKVITCEDQVLLKDSIH